jgi:hypothetical protein
MNSTMTNLDFIHLVRPVSLTTVLVSFVLFLYLLPEATKSVYMILYRGTTHVAFVMISYRSGIFLRIPVLHVGSLRVMPLKEMDPVPNLGFSNSKVTIFTINLQEISTLAGTISCGMSSISMRMSLNLKASQPKFLR